MDKFLVEFNKSTKNKYSYLRLKKVEFFEREKVAKLYFMIPEEIYENDFDNTVFTELKKYCAKVAPSYKCSFFFERLVVSEDIVKDYLLELFATNFPFLSVTINKSCIEVSIDETIQITLTIERDICDIIENTPFVRKVIESVEDRFTLETYLTLKVVDVGEIKIERSEHRIASKTAVPFVKYEYLCGVNAKFINKPIFIDTITKPVDLVSVCGEVKSIERRIFEEDPNSKFKYFRYNYRIKISDKSGEMSCYFKTNEDDCKLNGIGQGMQILLCGKVGFSERSGSYQMYAKTICTIELDNAKIDELLKPNPIPTTLKYPSIPYDGNDFVVSQTLFDLAEDNSSKFDFNCVFMFYKSVNKSFSPWEICMLSFENGHCKEVYQTFVKVSGLDRIDAEYKAKVSSAKRLAEFVPDILCFCNGKTLYCKNAEDVTKQLSAIAKAQHYEFNIEVQEANKLGTKNGQKFEPTFERMLKEYSITLADDSCYSACIAMAKLYMKVKK